MKTVLRTRNPLRHNGTSQYERLLEALMPDYFEIDENSVKDLLDATFRYSELLKYFDQNYQHKGDWACFWKVEMLTYLAHVSTLDPDAILSAYQKIKETYLPLIDDASGEDRPKIENEYHVKLIEYIRGKAAEIDNIRRRLPEDLPLRQEILALIQKDTLTDTEPTGQRPAGRIVEQASQEVTRD